MTHSIPLAHDPTFTTEGQEQRDTCFCAACQDVAFQLAQMMKSVHEREDAQRKALHDAVVLSEYRAWSDSLPCRCVPPQECHKCAKAQKEGSL